MAHGFSAHRSQDFKAALVKTLAPLPSWSDLAAAVLGKVPRDQDLSTPWRRDAETALWFSRGAWALGALVEGWKAAHDGHVPHLWLPDYFCNQSTAPARGAGARLSFYPVGSDMEPKWDICRQMNDQGAPDLFILVHYFGRAGDGEAAMRFCKEAGALLLEDAAHVLRPYGGIGSWGDATLYCPHKLLPAPDGALLLLRAGFPFAVPQADGPAPSSNAWLLKRVLQKLLPRTILARRYRRGPGFEDDPAFQPLVESPAMSDTARRLISRARAELTALQAKRRKAMIAELEKAGPGNAVLDIVSDDALAPYRFVAQFADSNAAAGRFDELRRAGACLETWPDLPPEVMAQEGRHADAIRLRRTRIFLPIHG